MEIRSAQPGELPMVMNVLDGALLATAAETVERAIGADRVLVATEGDRVLGVLVAAPTTNSDSIRIEAVAVRRNRRGQGLGSALVQAAADRHGHLVAEFDERVRAFWLSLGFDVELANEPDRFVGTLDPNRENS